MLLQLGCCRKCNGDLVMDEDDWRCLQCGRYYYSELPAVLEDDTARKRRPRNINALVHAKKLSDVRWWKSHGLVIAYLDAGRSVFEIAAITGVSPRHIRDARQRLSTERDRPPISAVSTAEVGREASSTKIKSAVQTIGSQ